MFIMPYYNFPEYKSSLKVIVEPIWRPLPALSKTSPVIFVLYFDFM